VFFFFSYFFSSSCSAFCAYFSSIFMAYWLSSAFRLHMSFLNATKLSTATIWSTIFLWIGFFSALSQACKKISWDTPSSASNSPMSSSTNYLNLRWISVYSSLFSSSLSNIMQYSSKKLIIGVFQRGDLKKLIIISKNQSFSPSSLAFVSSLGYFVAIFEINKSSFKLFKTNNINY
jgi:hypothetical protein